MLKFLNFNLKSILKYGVVGNTIIGVGLRGLGDSIQQNIEINSKKSQNYDFLRTCKISCSGFVIGPLNFFWYKYLDTKFPGKSLRVVAKKILLDQIYGATFFTFLFIMIVCLLDGKNFGESLREFGEKFPFIYLIDWIIWPPSQAVNFFLIPKELRVVFVNFILVCWNVFLSYVKYY
ncbi:mpv17 2 [Brachionus plicatilis]|uniref:Mpv17 2 n=1 Tax=Brachionus plicatilis TaxID=10195 RepID=A0A3M7RSN9_BRAPC|nr:mpv17 2 [Brachionus plicatilis]